MKTMLTQLVNLLENKENGLSLSEISRAMGAQPSAVASMIELLVQKGKLIEIGPDGKSTYGRPWPFPGSVQWVPAAVIEPGWA